MGNFPTHNCTYNDIPIVSPMSQLDCDERRCKGQAEQAELAADMYDLDYIEKRIEEFEAAVRVAMFNREHWELYREAKLRRAT